MNKNEKYDEFQELHRMRELAGVKENGNINVLTEAKTDLEQLTPGEARAARRRRQATRETRHIQNGPSLNEEEKWIQGAEKDIERRGTEGVCTGKKFGGSTCPKGSKRYNLAKTFRKMAKKRKGKKK